MANPTLLKSPIAENGDKNVIPASTGATTGLLDQEHGFQQINELPLQAGGLPPQRKDFNGAFNLLSKLLFYVQKGWQFEFDKNQDYYAGCIVKDTDGYMYECIADVLASSTHPQDDATNWHILDWEVLNYDLNSDLSCHIRFGSELLMQWGRVIFSATDTNKALTFPLSFKSQYSYKIFTTDVVNTVTSALNNSKAQATLKIPTALGYEHSVMWFAIGI